jgi:hypothetical protein
MKPAYGALGTFVGIGNNRFAVSVRGEHLIGTKTDANAAGLAPVEVNRQRSSLPAGCRFYCLLLAFARFIRHLNNLLDSCGSAIRRLFPISPPSGKVYQQ